MHFPHRKSKSASRPQISADWGRKSPGPIRVAQVVTALVSSVAGTKYLTKAKYEERAYFGPQFDGTSPSWCGGIVRWLEGNATDHSFSVVRKQREMYCWCPACDGFSFPPSRLSFFPLPPFPPLSLPHPCPPLFLFFLLFLFFFLLFQSQTPFFEMMSPAFSVNFLG